MRSPVVRIKNFAHSTLLPSLSFSLDRTEASSGGSHCLHSLRQRIPVQQVLLTEWITRLRNIIIAQYRAFNCYFKTGNFESVLACDSRLVSEYLSLHTPLSHPPFVHSVKGILDLITQRYQGNPLDKNQ